MPKRYGSGALAAVHKVAQGLAEAGAMAKGTLRGFDALCLTPVEPLSPEEIRALRLREKASQAVFARHLHVTTGLVSQWEHGEKQPSGATLPFVLEGCVATPSNLLPRGPATANRARRLLRSAPGSVGDLCQVIAVKGHIAKR